MFITLRLNIFLNILGILVAVLLQCSCYVGPSTISALSSYTDPHVYKLYPGKVLAESEIVKVNMTDAYYAIIDGFKVARSDYQQVLVLPGEHVIRWGSGGEAFVDLTAGNTYELRTDRTAGHGYSMFFWIQDAESGEVIADTKKP